MGNAQSDNATTAGIAAPPIATDTPVKPIKNTAIGIGPEPVVAPAQSPGDTTQPPAPPEPPKYVLRLDIPLDSTIAITDANARVLAQSLLYQLPQIGGVQVKLQQIYSDKAPRKVDL